MLSCIGSINIYELEFILDNDIVSLYRQAEDTPVLIYHTWKQRVDIV